MFKKNFLLLCALTAAYAPVAVAAPDCFREDEIVDVTKGKKCCRCCSLTVTNNATINGNLTVGGTVTATNFILSSGDTLFNGLRNWAVFSNSGAIAAAGPTVIPWDSTVQFTAMNKGITNLGGAITLPTTGLFLVMYTVKIGEVGEAGSELATLHLQQSTIAGGGGMTNITQAAVISHLSNLPVTDLVNTSQISGYALITVTSAANNVIDLTVTLGLGQQLPANPAPDANAQISILQLN